MACGEVTVSLGPPLPVAGQTLIGSQWERLLSDAQLLSGCSQPGTGAFSDGTGIKCIEQVQRGGWHSITAEMQGRPARAATVALVAQAG